MLYIIKNLNERALHLEDRGLYRKLTLGRPRTKDNAVSDRTKDHKDLQDLEGYRDFYMCDRMKILTTH